MPPDCADPGDPWDPRDPGMSSQNAYIDVKTYVFVTCAPSRMVPRALGLPAEPGEGLEGGSPPSNPNPRNEHFQNARETGGILRAHFENVHFRSRN